MSVRALFPKGKEPRYAFEVLIRMLPEAVLNFSSDGISLKALDPTKTALLDLTFYATALEDYSIDEETKVGIIFTTIKDVIKRIGATEKLELEVDKERNRFSFYIYPKKGREVGLVRRFSFPIVQVLEEEIPELAVSFDASFEIDSAVLDDILAMVDEVSDWIQITVSPDKVLFRGVGEGGKAAETELSYDSESVFNISAGEAASAKYSVEMLRDISGKMKSLSKRVKVELSANKPIRLTYEFTSGVFTATIAPRVD
ncbi:DNA polymerase sliding clamp [Pyrobaculum aerophilum]|uniref:DNA polymerase sliding clamp 2 n=2 Tax=Pyrobaculum aerophilum TaxID=13773 RepID=PCNA2_PYRAE|nr:MULTISPECIES: DNA polymerase sliding clamp [Pyrobaculum]Q8ZYL6.1 RecName: Full=DNA polymerase sliding clamp 2; AltName: Full=Proliferating cell nuclear antigen homolog 2; Short=PCNA 2 [Pyrobaculum aerophilum str. IM2]AAL62977.1 proliferating-cell nuclear antigen homolog (PCNA) [Pyrobaculum aerophilum str. IM2]MCX8137683.1 DNA polymerase sliding clamp [Pyrobaculum aerophilum]RFA93984.1 DNA polymerase sliding clamp [Pyrobaculum aerophilum]RFA95307.1 DNA polymerase sliding clamp [Pyrobaculum a